MADLARQVLYGIGLETTAGTPVPPTMWFNQLGFQLSEKSQVVNNESAWGRIEKTNSATVLRNWSEGSAEAKLTPNLGGLLLAAVFGSVTTVANADASGVVKDHTISILNNIVGKTFTLVRKDSIGTKAYPGCRFGEWTLTLDLENYLTFKANVIGLPPSSTTATAAMTEDVEFTPKHLTIKQAATVAAISAASNISTVQSFSLSCNPNLSPLNEAGSGSPRQFESNGFDLSFEMTKRREDATFETAYKNGTPASWQVTIENTDEVIGTAARGKFVFTAPRVTIADWMPDEGDLDSPINESVTGTIHYSPTDGYALRAVVTNTLATLI